MNLVKRIAAGVAGAVLIFSASTPMAADVQPVIPMQPPVVVVPPPPPGFDWSGAYVGAFFTHVTEFDPFEVIPLAVGGQVGFNIVRGSLVFGPQLRVGWFFPAPSVVATIGPRVGVLLGARDKLMLYGATSFGWIPGQLFYSFGGGVEFGIGQRFSIFTETRAVGVLGIGCCGLVMTTGANFHF